MSDPTLTTTEKAARRFAAIFGFIADRAVMVVGGTGIASSDDERFQVRFEPNGQWSVTYPVHFDEGWTQIDEYRRMLRELRLRERLMREQTERAWPKGIRVLSYKFRNPIECEVVGYRSDSDLLLRNVKTGKEHTAYPNMACEDTFMVEPLEQSDV